MTVGLELPARQSSRVMVTIEMAATARDWGVPGGVGESPLLGWVWWPPLPASTLGPSAPSLAPRPLQAGGGAGGVGGDGPAGRVGGVLVVVGVGVGTSGLAGCSSAPGTAVPSW